jgi:flagellar biosynthesis/type III secretory pathway protein FliH
MKPAIPLRVSGSIRSVRVSSTPPPPQEPNPPAPPPAPAPRAALDVEWMRAQQAKVQQACKMLESAASQLNQARSQLVADAEEQLLELAIGLASKAMMQEIQAGRHQIEPLLKEAILRVGGRQDVVVYLHPEDLAQCLTADGQTLELANVKFQADEVVRRGQCLVETSQGAMISSYTDRLEDLADAVRTRE